MINDPRYPTKFINQCFYIWWRTLVATVIIWAGMFGIVAVTSGLVEMLNVADPPRQEQINPQQ